MGISAECANCQHLLRCSLIGVSFTAIILEPLLQNETVRIAPICVYAAPERHAARSWCDVEPSVVPRL